MTRLDGDWVFDRWSALEICYATKVSARRLQWADERGYIKPAIVGHHREFSRRATVQALLVFALTDAGMSVKRAARLAQRVDVDAIWDDPSRLVAFMFRKKHAAHTIASYRHDDPALLRMATESRSPVVIICLEDKIARIKALKVMPRREWEAIVRPHDVFRRYKH